MGKMVDRDTDKDWNLLAEQDPDRAVLTKWSDTQRARKNDNFDDDFLKTGVEYADKAMSRIRQHFGEHFTPENALDFGCGVGRLLVGMAGHVKHLYGVDIAPAMLSRARKNFEKLENTLELAERMEDLNLPSNGVDWANSFIVFQHIPPSRGINLLEQLADTVKQDGMLTVQLTHWYGPVLSFPDASSVKQKLKGILAWRQDGEFLKILSYKDRYQPGGMSMFTYDMNEVFALLKRMRYNDVFLAPTNHQGIHGYHIIAKRS